MAANTLSSGLELNCKTVIAGVREEMSTEAFTTATTASSTNTSSVSPTFSSEASTSSAAAPATTAAGGPTPQRVLVERLPNESNYIIWGVGVALGIVFLGGFVFMLWLISYMTTSPRSVAPPRSGNGRRIVAPEPEAGAAEAGNNKALPVLTKAAEAAGNVQPRGAASAFNTGIQRGSFGVRTAPVKPVRFFEASLQRSQASEEAETPPRPLLRSNRVPPPSQPVSSSKNAQGATKKIAPPARPTDNTMDDGYNYDAMYEKPGNWDPPKISTDDSMVKHVLHELIVKKTTDITKIALPAYILEPRSGLETLSDFVRPDLLSSVPDFETPFERARQVVRAFLGGFLQMRGRRNLARKPYNPVLGEFFRCVWDVDKRAESNVHAKPLTLMSLPRRKTERSRTPTAESNTSEVLRATDQSGLLQADSDKFNVIAEQVSHHPPISAFYAECPKAGVLVQATMHVKAEPDLRLSFKPLKGVKIRHNGRIDIIDSKNGEKYTMGFPDAYCSNVLDVPKLDFTGDVSILSSNGYRSLLKFDEDFKVSGAIFKLDKEDPVAVFEGKWNGPVKISKGEQKGELLIDLGSLPTMVKNCAKVKNQDWLESRRLWRRVTRALSERDSKVCQSEKENVEERHRLIKIEPSFFAQDSEGAQMWKFIKER